MMKSSIKLPMFGQLLPCKIYSNKIRAIISFVTFTQFLKIILSWANMTTQIVASVLHGPKDLRVEEQIVPLPDPHELQIAISCTGICGSDLHYFSHYRLGDIP